MKCFECDDGVIRNVSYVIMQALFSYWKGRELEFQSGGYAVVGFERPSSPVTSGHFLYTSDDYAIIALPDSIAGVLEGIVIEIPEIKIPEIVIPEIAVPDVNVTLNPDYDITVRNDFTGLGDIISSAVSDALSVCLVPDATATMEMVMDMYAFFRFTDDIIAAVADLKEMLFEITPSPILKIPIGKPTSRKYDYGTGSYIIIDISWYAQYKQFGDKVVLAIAWALFLWRLYIKLPGIISGTEGSIVAADRAHDRYEKTKDSGRG